MVTTATAAAGFIVAAMDTAEAVTAIGVADVLLVAGVLPAAVAGAASAVGVAADDAKYPFRTMKLGPDLRKVDPEK